MSALIGQIELIQIPMVENGCSAATNGCVNTEYSPYSWQKIIIIIIIQ